MHPRPIVLIPLILSPVTILVGTLLLLQLIAGFRKGFGAFTELPPAAVWAGLVSLAIHAGFFAAPFLYYTSNRRSLALWLTAPIAILATLVALAALARLLGGEAEDARRWLIPAILGGIIVAYWAPVATLALAP